METTMEAPADVASPPAPAFEIVHAEWTLFFDELAAGRIDSAGELVGQFVAFYDGKVVGHGTDPLAVRHRVACTLGIHPERLVVSYRD